MILKYSSTKNRPPISQEIKKRIIENSQLRKKGISGGEGHFNTSLQKMGQLPVKDDEANNSFSDSWRH